MAKRLAIIGLGRISGAHLKGVRALNAAGPGAALEVALVVDPHPGRAEQWLGEHFADRGAAERPVVLDDWRRLLDPPHKPELASVLLPHHLHLEVVEPLLEAGIAVQVQKPIGLAMRDGRRMVEAARRTGTPLVCSEPSVLGRRQRLVLEWLASGRQIGRPTFMIDQAVIDLRGGFFMTPWRHLKGMAGAGWFIDHGVHRTHWMLEAFGPCATAYAAMRQIEAVRQDDRWGRIAVDTEDLAAAVLQFQSGVVVQWSVVSGGRGQSHHHVQVWGTQGSFDGGKVTRSGRAEAPEAPALDEAAAPPDTPEDPFAHSYQELLARMADPTAPVVGQPERALEAEAIVYACLESAHTGRPVAVADILNCRADAYERTVWAARAAVAGLRMEALT